MDKIHAGVLSKFHTLCSKAGVAEDDKRAMVRSYGVESSADIDTHDLIDMCAALEKLIPGNAELDKARKRAMASIGGWLEISGCKVMGNRSEYIKGIACRTTGIDRFNAIPIERLRNVYSLFCNKQNDMKRGAMVGLVDSIGLN
ncbi:MAG: phage protein GemA/Gp16 family protein [Muribaculaceae bacterium]